MDNTLTRESEAALRGPYLAAHRELRKAVYSHGGDTKGTSSQLATQLRTALDRKGMTINLVRLQLTDKAIRMCLHEFGEPDQIPEKEGFANYLQTRLTIQQGGLERAISNEKYRSEMLTEVGPNSPRTTFWERQLVLAQCEVAGRTKFIELLNEAFKNLLPPPAAQ